MGVPKNYFQLPNDEANRFETNPFGPGYRFKTGDLGLMRADGNLVHLGRADDQVKIRGFRIECGEIERTLLSNPLIHNAIVLPIGQNDEEPRLAAWISPKQSIQPIRKWLTENLPDYMIPSYWTTLNTFPTLANGRVNKNALPEPLKVETPMSPPRNNLEHKMVQTSL